MDNFETRKCPVTGNPVNVRVLANRNDPAGLEYLKAELKSEQNNRFIYASPDHIDKIAAIFDCFSQNAECPNSCKGRICTDSGANTLTNL